MTGVNLSHPGQIRTQRTKGILVECLEFSLCGFLASFMSHMYPPWSGDTRCQNLASEVSELGLGFLYFFYVSPAWSLKAQSLLFDCHDKFAVLQFSLLTECWAYLLGFGMSMNRTSLSISVFKWIWRLCICAMEVTFEARKAYNLLGIQAKSGCSTPGNMVPVVLLVTVEFLWDQGTEAQGNHLLTRWFIVGMFVDWNWTI